MNRRREVVDTQVTIADMLPCMGTAHFRCVQALARSIVGTGDANAKIILRSDNEVAILDLKRQAPAECRVKHGMTVILDDAEYDSQSNGLADLVVLEVKV